MRGENLVEKRAWKRDWSALCSFGVAPGDFVLQNAVIGGEFTKMSFLLLLPAIILKIPTITMSFAPAG